jgi:hypothetical protein
VPEERQKPRYAASNDKFGLLVCSLSMLNLHLRHKEHTSVYLFADALKTAMNAMQAQKGSDDGVMQTCVLWTLLHGRPMTCYEQLGTLSAALSWGPRKGWSARTGWRMAENIASVVRRHIRQKVLAAHFMAFSLDESTDTAGVFFSCLSETASP